MALEYPDSFLGGFDGFDFEVVVVVVGGGGGGEDVDDGSVCVVDGDIIFSVTLSFVGWLWLEPIFRLLLL